VSVRTGRGAITTDQTPANIRFYRPGDEEGILRVLQASFPRWPDVETDVAPIDHLRWKLASGAHPEHNSIVAQVDGEIVGVRLGIAQPYSVKGEPFIGRCDIDSCVLPELRGRGIYSSMIHSGNHITPDFDLFTTSTDRSSLTELDRGLGHRPLGNKLTMMICDLVGEPAAPLGSGCLITQIHRFDGRIETFWAKAARQFDLIALPSRPDLDWRYCDARGGIGAVLQAEEGTNVVGFAALRVSHGKGYVAYLLALPERADVVSALVRHSLTYFRKAGIAEVASALPKRHPYRSTLVQEGFTRTGHTVPFTARPLRPEVDVSLLQHRKAAVHLMLGDTDLV